MFVAITSLSCGGGGGGAGTTDQFCTQKAEKECQVVPRCGTAVMATCLSQRKTACLTFAAAQTVAPRIFRSGNVAKCLDKTKEIYAKSTPITAADLAAIEDVCAYVFQGDVKKEKPCKVKYDCEGDFICDKTLCASKVVKKKDQLCGNPGEICETGAYCTMVDMVLKCAPKKLLGDSCDDAGPCIEALRCDGTCKERIAAGEACGTSDDCVPTASFCDPYIGNRCDTGLGFAPNAPACGDYGGTIVPGTGGASGGTGGTGGRVDSGAGGSGGSAADSGAPDVAAEAGDDETGTD